MSLCALSHGTSFDTVLCVRHVQFFGYHRCSHSEFNDKPNVVASAGRAGVAAFKLEPFGEERRWVPGRAPRRPALEQNRNPNAGPIALRSVVEIWVRCQRNATKPEGYTGAPMPR